MSETWKEKWFTGALMAVAVAAVCVLAWSWEPAHSSGKRIIGFAVSADSATLLAEYEVHKKNGYAGIPVGTAFALCEDGSVWRRSLTVVPPDDGRQRRDEAWFQVGPDNPVWYEAR